VRPYQGPVDGFLFRSDRWQPGYAMRPEDVRHVGDLYDGEVHDLDRAVRAFLDGLGLAQGGTAVLVTSDHGEGLGEHGTWNHDDVREPQVRIPLLVRLPESEPRGERRSHPASGIDVAPTLLGLAGLVPPETMEGTDLLAGDPGLERERWVDDRDHLDPDEHRFALYHGRWKLVRFGYGATARDELYDLAADPSGFVDVGAQHPAVRSELATRLAARLGDGGATTPCDSSASGAALHALGYTGD
jgi:arylsulfatase A-like enzyme